jgi:hypothetical protein
MERVVGIEPTSSAWKAEVLPLNYTRLVMTWNNPNPLRSKSARLSSPYPFRGGGGRIRTYEGVSRQIYSLLPLAAWVPLRENEPRILISALGAVNAEIGPEDTFGSDLYSPREFK